MVDHERIDHVLSLLLDMVGNLTSLDKKTFHSLEMPQVSVVFESLEPVYTEHQR